VWEGEPPKGEKHVNVGRRWKTDPQADAAEGCGLKALDAGKRPVIGCQVPTQAREGVLKAEEFGRDGDGGPRDEVPPLLGEGGNGGKDTAKVARSRDLGAQKLEGLLQLQARRGCEVDEELRGRVRKLSAHEGKRYTLLGVESES